MKKPTKPLQFYVETFGCQMNVADSEEMGAELLRRGFTPTSNKEDADVVLLNTCTVRQHAEQRALSFIGRLKEWKKQRPGRKVIVAGCAAERLKKNLKGRFPQVDLVAGAKSIERIPQIFDRFFDQPEPAATVKPAGFDWFNESEMTFGQGELRSEGPPLVLGHPDDTAFVTIMRGCNYSCSYCIVPAVRGREIYRQAEKILDEIRAKAAAGARKLMLLGQTVNSYWHRKDPSELASGSQGELVDFASLLRQVAQVPGIEEIRFMSPHPHYMSDKLIAALGEIPQISNEIHLPVQSGSDPVLVSMKRNYTRAEYAGIASKLRRARPGLALSTDFIVGFPGETEEDFERTLSFAEEIRFSMAYCFKYSPRAGTESAAQADDVPENLKEERLGRLLAKMENLRGRETAAGTAELARTSGL